MKLLTRFAQFSSGVLTLMISVSANASFLPENNLWILDDPTVVNNVTEEEFNQSLDAIAAIYAPIIETHGAKLSVRKNWSSSTVNASAQQFGGTWILNFYGGLARREEITLDGFVLVACHELGHHLGGFPFVTDFFGNATWAANEGQADYFATQVCARQLWADEHEKNATFRAIIPATAQAQCDAVWSTEAEQDLCYRVSMGGLALGNLLATLQQRPLPSFDTPDTTVVNKTNHRHPAAQCRLDTYVAGALCHAAFDQSKIPGKNHPAGQGSAGAEKEAAQYSFDRFRGRAPSSVLVQVAAVILRMISALGESLKRA